MSSEPATRPPWSVAEPQFLNTCTACDRCIAACDEGILKRGAGGYPEVDFQNGACTFCGACADACAPGAISTRDIATASPWTLEARIGSDCLSANGVTCRVCGDRCDARAIRFQLAVGGVADPIIDHSSCTGCGACVAPCPVGAVDVIHSQAAPRPVGVAEVVTVQMEEQS